MKETSQLANLSMAGIILLFSVTTFPVVSFGKKKIKNKNKRTECKNEKRSCPYSIHVNKLCKFYAPENYQSMQAESLPKHSKYNFVI